MKASLSTMRYMASEYSTTEKDLLEIGIDELKVLATNRLGGLESIEEYGKRFDGIVVAKVVSCEEHKDSDHLHVCMIDDGRVTPDVERNKDGYVQVVCGAPNVRSGLTVAWIPPRAVVPKSFDETERFVLSTREIRGVMSNGMLASASELGLFEDHSGILEIDEAEVGDELAKAGTDFKKLYGLDDVLIDIENKMFTHRPDCFGQIGLARELAAIQGMSYTSPQWYWKKPELKTAEGHEVVVFNETGEAVPRLMTVAMSGVTVGESPVWLKSFITRMGGKPVNNVVDISNYIMHITGQPTHAYDLGKIKGKTIGARFAKQNETIALLNGKTATLSSEDLVIADAERAIGIAGIMGGNETEVDESTTELLLEVASFDMYTIRKTAMRQGLFTDAFTRFSKGQSPLQNDRVIAKFMEMLSEITGANQSSKVHDKTTDGTEKLLDQHAVHGLVKTSVDFINQRLGTELGFDEIYEILKRVEMAVIKGDDGEFEVGAPYWRTDIELPEDVVEEVGRLYGFDRLALKLPARSTKPAPRNDLNDFKSNIRRTLASAGANEVLSYSFVHSDVLQKSGIEDAEKWCYHIRNAISPDLQCYRPMLMPSLVSKVHLNIKSDMVRSDDNEFAIFELGKVHVKNHLDDEKLPSEMERVALVFAAEEKTASRKYSGSPYYMAKRYLQLLVNGQATFEPLATNEYPITASYELMRSAQVSIGGQVLGVVGEFRRSVKKAFKLPEYCAGFELDLSLLNTKLLEPAYQPIGTYPKTQQDITFSAEGTSYADIESLVRKCLQDIGEQHGYEYSVGPRDIFKKDGSAAVNYTFRIWLWHPHKTLTTEETNAALDTIASGVAHELGAKRI